MTIAIRPNWHQHATPFDMRVLVEPNPAPGINWSYAFEHGMAAVHEDVEDALQVDGTWGMPGPDGTYKAGGSGLSFAYGADDIDALVVADQAIRNRPLRYNLAHWCREGRYPWTLSDATRD